VLPKKMMGKKVEETPETVAEETVIDVPTEDIKIVEENKEEN